MGSSPSASEASLPAVVTLGGKDRRMSLDLGNLQQSSDSPIASVRVGGSMHTWLQAAMFDLSCCGLPLRLNHTCDHADSSRVSLAQGAASVVLHESCAVEACFCPIVNLMTACCRVYNDCCSLVYCFLTA